MNERTYLPHKLDLGAFINEESRLEGLLPLANLSRLASGLAQDLELAPLEPLSWWAEGRLEPQRVGAPQLWLDLHAEGNFPWECQRCLQPVFIPVTVNHTVRFVADEAAAAELDADSEFDVLAISRQFDLLALIEDELIMAQPIVPRHDECPTDVQSLMQSGLVAPDGTRLTEAELDELESPTDKPNPFAILAALKKGQS